MPTSQKNEIIVVSGLPRSGTSLMMQLLEKAGLPLLIDQVRTADIDNLGGYYEYEPVKQMKNGDRSWMELAQGKGVKIISYLLFYLPPNYRYKVIFMQRNFAEIIASQDEMLKNRGEKEEHAVSEAELIKLFSKHLDEVRNWMSKQNYLDVFFLDYNQLIRDPANALQPLGTFLNRPMVSADVLAVVDRRYYRQRAG